MQIKFPHSIFLSLFIFFVARSSAEINIANSIEWIMCQSDLVVKGNVTYVDMKGDKLSCTIEITEGLKGTLSVTTLDFTLPSSKSMTDRLKKIMVGNKDIIVFLKNNNVEKKKMPAEYTPICDDGSGLYYVVDLSDPMNMLISASDFKVLKDPISIIQKCKYIASQVNTILDKKKRSEFKKYFLSVPFETEAYYVIYSGSSCFLYVPDALFPAAKSDFQK